MTGDCGWWLGMINENAGLFPMNYVREIVARDKPNADVVPGQYTLPAIPFKSVECLSCIGAGNHKDLCNQFHGFHFRV